MRAQLSMEVCIDSMSAAMIAVANGEIFAPPRAIMPLVDRTGFFVVMPGSAPNLRVYGAKMVSLHPSNPAHGRPAVQGFVALFDYETGAPLALVDGSEITALRTAAASALATRALANSEARTLGLLGCGVQAASHLEAVAVVRPITDVYVWGRSQEKAEGFAARHDGPKAKIHVARTAKEAAACDVVCVVTGASEPVIRGEWVHAGCHVNLVGAHQPTTREADTELIARARVFVDSLEGALREAGDLLIPIREGAVERAHIAGEIGSVLLGVTPGRCSEEEITVYKSLGLVAQDLVAAYRVYSLVAGSSR